LLVHPNVGGLMFARDANRLIGWSLGVERGPVQAAAYLISSGAKDSSQRNRVSGVSWTPLKKIPPGGGHPLRGFDFRWKSCTERWQILTGNHALTENHAPGGGIPPQEQ
jgi:hypothetical protein